MPLRPVAFGPLNGVFHDASDAASASGSAAGPAFACIHGLTLDHDMFAELGARAERLGISVLRFHMRGHFDSGGKLEEQGFEDEIADALDALSFLRAQPGVDPARVGLLGFSIGGAVAAVVSKRSPLKALATWGSLLDTARWKDERYAQYRGAEDGIVRIWDGIGVSARLFSEAIACNPFQDALDFGGPYFAAHGGRDRNHPQEKSMELVQKRQSLGRPAEGFFPPSSGHKFQNPQDRERLNAMTLDFFRRSL
jgi:dipeptidyl aminopeptidase/acylaminoacyl peptidase